MPNTIKIKFTGQDVIAYYGPWQYDYGLVLEIQGLMNLPTLTQVHFARKGSPTAEIRIGTYADGVLAVSIPDIMLAQSAEFWAYVYLTDGESAQTIKGIQFYPNARPEPDDVITPDEQNAVDQLVAELNALIAAVEEVNDTATASAQEAAESADVAVVKAREAAESLSKLTSLDVSATGLPAGSLPSVVRSETEGGIALEFRIPKGDKGDKGDTGTPSGFGTPTATANTLAAGESATAAVVASGDATAKIFAFTFGVPQGLMGYSAYDQAVTGGYTDTEAAFLADLAAIEGLAAELEALL